MDLRKRGNGQMTCTVQVKSVDILQLTYDGTEIITKT